MAQDKGWGSYYDKLRDRPPRRTVVAALDAFGERSDALAVDLGCGDGRDVIEILRRGWRVVAVDSEPSTPARLAQQIGNPERLEVRVQAFKDLRLEGVDLLHAAYALPFTDPADFPSVWQELRDALNPGGWLAVDLFGDRDDWAHTEGMTFLTRSQVEALLQGLDVVLLDEEDEDGHAFTGPKHWHVFHVLARQP